MVIEKISILVEIARRLSHRKGSTYWDFESYYTVLGLPCGMTDV
jgi:hypothetical protein